MDGTTQRPRTGIEHRQLATETDARGKARVKRGTRRGTTSHCRTNRSHVGIAYRPRARGPRSMPACRATGPESALWGTPGAAHPYARAKRPIPSTYPTLREAPNPMTAMTTTSGIRVRPTELQRAYAIQYACPWCGAGPGEACTRPRGTRKASVHAKRLPPVAPQCHRCWRTHHPGLRSLTSLSRTKREARCHWCGRPTHSQIYALLDGRPR